MTRPQFYTLALCLLVSGGALRAQESQQTAFSLQQAIDFALKNSPSHNNAQLDQRSAVHKKREIAGIGYPQISASADVKNYIVIPTSLFPVSAIDPTAPADMYLAVKFGTKYNATAGFSASQVIFSSDYIFGLKASTEFMNLSRINIDRSKAEVAAQVSKAYYNVMINRERLKLFDVNIAQLKKIYEDTRAANQQGLVENIDVERLEVQYNNLRSERDRTERLIGLTETLLKFQMGYSLSSSIVLTDSLNVESESYQELGGGKIDISQRPELRLLQSQRNLLELDVKRLKYGYLPTLAAYGAYQFNTQRQKPDFFTFDKNNPVQQWYKIALIGATLNVNVFDGFQRHNKIQQAKITALKNQNDLANLMLASELEATIAAVNYNNAYASVLIQKKNMDLARHVYEVSNKKYESGVGSNLEVVTAETALRAAETNYYNAYYDLLVARIDYRKATGTLVK